MKTVRFLVAALLLVLLLAAARAGIAAYYFRKISPQSVQKAMLWDAGNPQYPATAGNLIHFYGDHADPELVIRMYEKALQLSPFEAEYCASLAQANDWAGRPGIAVPLFERALELFPNSPEINWKVANYRVRSGKTSEALPLLKKVLSSGGVDRNQVFALLSKARVDKTMVVEQLLPADAPSTVAYLDFQVDRGDLDSARLTWNHLLALEKPFEISASFPYIDALIRTREVARAREAWFAAAGRFPLLARSLASSRNLVSNGDFRAAIVNGGFDWRVNPVAGASVRQEPDGTTENNSALRIDFDGSQNLSYDSVVQFIATEPNTSYDFSALLSSQGITTDSGVGVRISDAYNPAEVFGSTDTLTGTIGPSKQDFSFTTHADTRLLLLSVFRMRSQKFDDKVAGTFRMSKVQLVPRS